jgi:hypothetical protein
MSEKNSKPSSPSKKRVPRPDELTKETFEFIAAVDEYKRTHMVSIVTLEQVLEVLGGLGYENPAEPDGEIEVLEEAVEEYKTEHNRLFPNWSEIFQVALGVGYSRKGEPA